MKWELNRSRLRPLWIALMWLLCVWFGAWFVVPVWLKGFVQEQGRAALGRDVHVDVVSFRPWSLELEIKGLRVAGLTPDAPALLELDRLYVDAELQSAFRLAPVVDAVVVERPTLRLRHLGDGRYDVDDLLARWAQRPRDGKTLAFGLFNLVLSGGELQVDDVPTAVQHRLNDLSVAVPFLSNLPTQRNVRTEPRIAFDLNGSRFDTQLSTLPFADTLATRARLSLPDLDLEPYLPYWPKTLSWRPLKAKVQADLILDFEQRQAPEVRLSGRLAVRDLALVQNTGAVGAADRKLMSWQALAVELADSRLLERQVHIGQLALEGPQLHVWRDASGLLNLSRLWPRNGEAGGSAPDKAEPTWRLKLDQFKLTQGTVHWRDATVSPAWDTSIEALALSTGVVVWPASNATPVEASARWRGASLDAKGEVSPTHAQMALKWRDLGLGALAPYVDQVLTQPLAGRSAGDLSLRWQAAANDARKGAASDLQLQWQDVLLQDLAVGPASRPALALRELRLANGSLDLAGRSADLGKVSLLRPTTNLARDAAGRWMWADWLRTATSVEPATDKPLSPGPVWRWGWQALQLSEGSGRLDDATTPTPVALRWNGLQLRLGAWRSDVVVETPISVATWLAAAGQNAVPGSLSLDGRLALRPASAPSSIGGKLSARFKLERLPAHSLAPYFAGHLNLGLQRADISWRGDLSLEQGAEGLAATAAGDFTVDDLRALDASDGSPLLDWKTLNLRGLRLALAPGQPLKLSIAETALSDYFARIDIDPSGRVNLQNLLRTAAAEAPVSAPAGPPAQLSFGPIALVNGQIDFSDRFVRPNYSARLSQVTGSLGTFSNQGDTSASPAKVSLRGRVEGTGSLDIDGVLQPLAKPPVLDMVGTVRELELPPLSTYALKYTGHGIARGQLSVDVRYQVGADGRLTASNQLTLHRLVLGDREPSSEAPNLPVKLAVALLADRQGVIDINLPISGSLNDPEFRLAPIIGRLILGLIGKAVSAPFALLGNVLGGPEAQTGRIDFVPGTDRFKDGAAATLSAIARVLNDRPALQLTVVGHSDVATEREHFQRERLRQAVQAEKRRQALRAGQSADPEAAVAPEEYPALLLEVYRRSDFPKPRNAIGLLKELSVPEMEVLWLTHAPAPDEALRELATRRALAVKSRLVADGLVGARVFVEVAKEGGVPNGSQADLQLSVP